MGGIPELLALLDFEMGRKAGARVCRQGGQPQMVLSRVLER